MAGEGAVGDEKYHRSLQLEWYNFSKLGHTQILDTATENITGS